MLALAVAAHASLLAGLPYSYQSLTAHGAGWGGPGAWGGHGGWGGPGAWGGPWGGAWGGPSVAVHTGPGLGWGAGHGAPVAALAALGHGPISLAQGPAGHEGQYVAKTRGAIHTAPLAGHINSATSLNLAPAPGTL